MPMKSLGSASVEIFRYKGAQDSFDRKHYCDVIMSVASSQITGVLIICSTVSSGADQRNFKAPRHWPLWGESTGDRLVTMMTSLFSDKSTMHQWYEAGITGLQLRINIDWTCYFRTHLCYPYPEPVYTGWSSVHWNATGIHWMTQRILAGNTGTPLEKLSWNSPTLECHWRNLVESGPHWDATGETLTFAAYTGTPLEGLWQPTHAPTHI